MSNALPSVALVLETTNLHGGGSDPDRVADGVEMLVRHLRAQTFPLCALRELVVTHEGLSAAHREHLARAAGRSITFVQLAPGTTYYAAKNAGFDETTAEVVAFADADCWPDPNWLCDLVAPFADPLIQATAGQTTYRDTAFGRGLSAIDFMHFESPLGPSCTRNFYANNVAFRRGTFAKARYACDGGFFRGNCQTLGLRLQRAQVPILFVPRAHTTHRLPDSAWEHLLLRLYRGADAVDLSPHLVDAYLPPSFRWVAKLGPLSGVSVLVARTGFSLMAINRVRPSRLSALPWCAAAATVLATTATDLLGALMWPLLRRRATDARLSYHADIDHLESAA